MKLNFKHCSKKSTSPNLPKIIFARLTGDYGGSHYEDNLAKILDLNKMPSIQCVEPRLGGVSSILSLVKIFIKITTLPDGILLRPFGLPIYRKKTIVLFHHRDDRFDKWYSKLIERFDYLLLLAMKKYLEISFIAVSDYWKCYLQNKGFNVIAVLYNELHTPFLKCSEASRFAIADKYGLDKSKPWIFLGSLEEKKGGYELYNSFPLEIKSKYEFIFSGTVDSRFTGIKVAWFEGSDYFHFLSCCRLIIANSQFQEGWCRVIHEGVLMGIPVFGNGAGGMSELLTVSGLVPYSNLKKLAIKIQQEEFRLGDKDSLLNFLCIKNSIALDSIRKYVNRN